MSPNMGPVPQSATYSVAEAGHLIGVSNFTIYRLLQRGKLRAIASIRHKRIPKAELERFLRDSLGRN